MSINKRIRIAIISTHPIQYYAPVFKLLAEKTELKVFYTAGENIFQDKGFQHTINWDIPLLEGYNFTFLTNVSKSPGTHHFMGIRNTNAIYQIEDFKPDHLLMYGWSYHSHLKLMRYFKGKIPLTFRGDSTLLNEKKNFNALIKKIILCWVYKHVNQVLYTGTNNKAYFKKYALTDQQLIFAPHAIDNKRFGKGNDFGLRKNLQIRHTDILILYAGKFLSVKNPLLLLQAFLELNLPGTHLLFVGSGALETILKTRSLQYSQVHFMPFQNQTAMPSIYQACDLFCLPSSSESWGLSINEAMAAGKAILASDKVGAAKDLVKLKNGKIFKSNNLPDLKIKLKELLTNRLELKIRGKSSRNIIASWNFETQVKNIISAFN